MRPPKHLPVVRIAYERTDPWDNPAPCATDPELWFSDHPDDRDTARRICGTCPPRDHCAQAAADLKPEFGTWAGIDREAWAQRTDPCPDCGLTSWNRNGVCRECRSRREKARRAAKARPPRKVAECGTRAGYQAHHAKNEKPCDQCRDASNDYEQLRRDRRIAARKEAS